MFFTSENTFLLRIPVLLHLVVQVVQHGTDLLSAALVVLNELGQVHVEGRVLLQQARLVRVLLYGLVSALCLRVNVYRIDDAVHHRDVVCRAFLDGRPHGHSVRRGVQQRLGDVLGIVVQAFGKAGQQRRIPVCAGEYGVLRPLQPCLGQHTRRRGHSAAVRSGHHLLDKLVDEGLVRLVVDGPLVVWYDQVQDVSHSGRVRHGLLRRGIRRRGGCVQLLGQPAPVLHVSGHAHQNGMLGQGGGVQPIPFPALPHELLIFRRPAAVVCSDDGLGPGVPADHSAVPSDDGGAVLCRRAVRQQSGVEVPAHFLDLYLARRPASVSRLQFRRICRVHRSVFVVGHYQPLRRHNGIGKLDRGVPLGVGFVLVSQDHSLALFKGIILPVRFLVHRKSNIRVFAVKCPAVCDGAFYLPWIEHRIGPGVSLPGHDTVISVFLQKVCRFLRVDNLPGLRRPAGSVPGVSPLCLRYSGPLRQIRRRRFKLCVHLANIRRVLRVKVRRDHPRASRVDLRRRQRPFQAPGLRRITSGVCRVRCEPHGFSARIKRGELVSGSMKYQQRSSGRVLDLAPIEPPPEGVGLCHGLRPLDPLLQVCVLPQRRLG